MLVWRKGNIEKKLSLCYIIVYYSAQRYQQFLQVGRLYRALILLSLALSSKSLCVLDLHSAICKKNCLLTFFYLALSEPSLVGLALDVVD